MTLTSFLKFVEIQTKVASLIPFFMGTVYTLYRYDSFNVKNFIFMFISLICVDMATTAINNYFDYKKARKKHGYNYEIHNVMVKDSLKESTALITIFILLALAVTFGLLLFMNTNVILLLIGIISFGAAVLYSFGPIPISRMPLGEIFSGLFMGFIIVFLSVYIHIYDKGILFLTYKAGVLNVGMNLLEIIFIFLVSIPTILGIANIMLANNTCDIEDDIENRRYTLPIYIGRVNSLKLFRAMYYISFIDIILLVILKIEPLTALITLITFIPVNKNIQIFFEKQTKKDTFIMGVKNFILINALHVISVGIGVVIKYM